MRLILVVTAVSVIFVLVVLVTTSNKLFESEEARVVSTSQQTGSDTFQVKRTKPVRNARRFIKRRDDQNKQQHQQQSTKVAEKKSSSSLLSLLFSKSSDNANSGDTTKSSGVRSPYGSDPDDPVYHGDTRRIFPTQNISNRAKEVQLEPNAKAGEDVLHLYETSFDKAKLDEGSVIPAVIIPTFRDGDVLRHVLANLDTPVRHFTFINNADDTSVQKVMRELEPLKQIGAVTIIEHDWFNRGFARSINLGIRRSREVLLGKSEMRFLKKWKHGPLWYFAVNCDAIFKPESGAKFAQRVNANLNDPTKNGGLFYGHIVDQFAFGIADEAVRKAGYFDEVFYPAYMEDIDFKWRVHLAGFSTVRTGAIIEHHVSINLKRQGGRSVFKRQMHRGGLGFEYGWMKWGYYEQHHTRKESPPSGRKTPFGIPNFPLHLWSVDQVHRQCIITEQGVYFSGSSTCWYNGTGLLRHLPEGTVLPRFLREPTVSMREYLNHGAKNDRVD